MFLFVFKKKLLLRKKKSAHFFQGQFFERALEKLLTKSSRNDYKKKDNTCIFLRICYQLFFIAEFSNKY
jgi:hypothetical protein